MARPLLSIAASLAAGCLLGGEADPSSVVVMLVLAAGLLLLAALSPRGRFVRSALAMASFGLGAAGAAVERSAYDACPLRLWVEARDDATPVRLAGWAAADGVDLGGGLRLQLDV